MSDFDYTDLTETGNIPLGQPWERAAIKDLSDVLHYLTHGLFFNPTDYADRLRQAADAIESPIVEISQPLTGELMFPGNEVLQRLGSDTEPIQFASTPGRLFILLAQLQLALRHPGNTGTSAEIARDIALHLQAGILARYPELEALCTAGWQQEYDISRSYLDQEFPRDV